MREDRKERLEKVIIPSEMPIHKALQVLDSAGTGILLVCDSERHLLGVVTDGDIRRAILHAIPFLSSCMSIANKNFVSAPEGISHHDALHVMDHSKKFVINHLPVVNSKSEVVDLLLRRDLVTDGPIPLQAVIMAGGFGTRLGPLTEKTPKPMLHVGNKPILEHIITKLQKCGIKDIKITTHYLPEKITDYFGNGEKFNVNLEYIHEDNPLGTAGALGFIKSTNDPLLVINGDILTGVDFHSMLNFHREHDADMTVAIRRYKFQVPYGVVECEGHIVSRLQEKPTHHFFVNAGIYLIQPSVRDHIPRGKHFDMTDLIKVLINRGNNVVSFPIIEHWLDIGQPDDLKKATEMYHTDLACQKTDLS